MRPISECTQSLLLYNEIVPGLAPIVYDHDADQSWVSMGYLAGPRIMRQAVLAGDGLEGVGRDLGQFVAALAFATSEMSLDATTKRARAVEFSNPELCHLQEDFVFTNPYFESPENEWNLALDADVLAVRSDRALKIAIAAAKADYMTCAEALLHGDLHTGSVMIAGSYGGTLDTKVIDPELAFYRPRHRNDPGPPGDRCARPCRAHGRRRAPPRDPATPCHRDGRGLAWLRRRHGASLATRIQRRPASPEYWGRRSRRLHPVQESTSPPASPPEQGVTVAVSCSADAWGSCPSFVSHRRSTRTAPTAGERASRRKNLRAAALFLLPALSFLVVFRLAPILVVVRDSFHSAGEWVGLENFRFLFDADVFRDSLLVTLRFNAIVNPLQVAIAFALALAIADGARRPGLWQTLNLLPIAVPLAVSAVVWGVAFRPDDGIVNAVLTAVGLPDQPWLTSPDQALLAIVILASWVGVGYWSLFLVAGLHQVTPSVAEAAAMDGAGYWRTLWSVRLPLMRRPLAFVLVADTVVNLLLFAPIQILTRGGPEGSTNVVMFDTYRTAFVFNDFPLTAAQTVLLIAVVLLIVAIQFRLLNAPGVGDDS